MSEAELLKIKRLPIAERVALVEDIWNSIADDAGKLEIPEWHRQLIRERLAKYHHQVSAGSPWPEVRKRIEQERLGA
jgi:putative addiction module component (TIGR02574 family)